MSEALNSQRQAHFVTPSSVLDDRFPRTNSTIVRQIVPSFNSRLIVQMERRSPDGGHRAADQDPGSSRNSDSAELPRSVPQGSSSRSDNSGLPPIPDNESRQLPAVPPSHDHNHDLVPHRYHSMIGGDIRRSSIHGGNFGTIRINSQESTSTGNTGDLQPPRSQLRRSRSMPQIRSYDQDLLSTIFSDQVSLLSRILENCHINANFQVREIRQQDLIRFRQESIKRQLNTRTLAADESCSMAVEKDCCSICLCEFLENDEIATLECGHVHHVNCIREWLYINNQCPLCKRTGVARA